VVTATVTAGNFASIILAYKDLLITNNILNINFHSMGERNSVVETAVKRTSWGKSRNELLCCFHNSGGLHRISGDALLETRILTHEGNHDNSRLIDNSTCDVDVNANHIPEPRDAMHGNGIPGIVEGCRLDARRRDGSRGSSEPLNAMHGIVVTGVAN
jgi:hypothetical protein